MGFKSFCRKKIINMVKCSQYVIEREIGNKTADIVQVRSLKMYMSSEKKTYPPKY